MSATSTGNGKVVVNRCMSLDGFIAAPGGRLDWMQGFGEQNDEVTELIPQIGAVLAGRHTYDVGSTQSRPEFRGPYGGAFSGTMFVLTHHPPKDTSVTFLSGDITQAVTTAAEAAGEKYVALLGADVARQAMEAELVDDVLIHMVPILLGDGVRLYTKPGGDERHLELISVSRAVQVVNLRFGFVG